MNDDARESAQPPGPGSQAPLQPQKRRHWPSWAGLAGIALTAIAAIVAGCAMNGRLPAPAPSATSTLAPPATTAPGLSAQTVAMATHVAVPTRPPAMAMQKSWILRPTLPPDATQADGGAQIYRLVCGTCHGFAGEGLSYGPWVKTDPENCWKANCHGGGHPPGGFSLPRYIPPVIGPGTLTHFQNAFALYEYVRATMPMYAPGTMLDEEYWEVTAFLVRENGVDPIRKPLDPQRAAEVTLR